MKRFLFLMLATPVATAASAQHSGHMMSMPAPEPAAQAPAKARVKPAPAPSPATAAPAQPHHASAKAQPPAAAQDPHAGHGMAPAAPDPHAGHTMPVPPEPVVDPHAGHTAPGHAPGAADPPVAPPPAAALGGPRDAADAVYGPGPMADARGQLRREHGAITTSKVLIDRLEARIHDGRNGYEWDVQGWSGGDIRKLWIKSEGGGSFGAKPERIELQALYSRAIDPWFNLQAGIRHDVRPNPDRTHLVLGIQGLAPYWFEVDGSLFVSDKGELTARFKADYDQRLTQKLILQPHVELDLAAEDIAALGVGSGLSSGEAGLRLRYEFVPEFAPYLGVSYERAFGDTADFRRADAEKVGGWSLLLGVRGWF